MNKHDSRSGTIIPVSQFIVATALLLAGLPSYSQLSSPQLYDNNDPSFSTEFSPELLNVRTLVKANVLDLAQLILETEGPPDLPNKVWLNWERQLWKLYQIRENWQGLYQRARQIPSAFPQKIHREADLQAIHALLKLNDGKQARVLLRKHLSSGRLLELERRRFRKLIIESYLADDLLTEAGVAMKNYQSDFDSAQEDWLLLSAKIYLKHNYPGAAANLLSTITLPAARLLRIFSRLKNQSIDPARAISEAQRLFAELRFLRKFSSGRSALKAHQILAVIIYAKHFSDELPPAVDELEQYLIEIGGRSCASCARGIRPPGKAEVSIPYGTSIDHAVHGDNAVADADNVYPQYTASDLLAAYKAAALAEAAQAELPHARFLSGDNLGWLDYIMQLPAKQVARKKPLYGYLLQNPKDQFIRRQLNNLFVTALIQSERIDIIPQLYGAHKPFGKLALSGDVGLELSNAALAMGNFRLAAEANQAVTEIPQGMERTDWLLHTARISIIAGDYDQGAKDLMLWIEESDDASGRLEPEQTDRVLQPIFDLQTANQHELALKLLHAVNTRSPSDRHRREIAYWIAESYQATRQYTKAANYFLFSALQKKNGFDQWGEAARYQAAQSLLSANLISDSRALFKDLLARAVTDSRKTQLKQKLQELWLHESSLNSVESFQ
ncbi:tetratricopeptide repeat protein [Candidatus Spongiihabitans sp.]|uniref:tetratricopeptide repeat protein n=1 Tax=Candidatus Spongiihabitans sp. TaxID=3101308 RepID=UPI003C7A1057